MTRLLIPLVAAVTLALLAVWLMQRPVPATPSPATPAADASAVSRDAATPLDADAAAETDVAAEADEADGVEAEAEPAAETADAEPAAEAEPEAETADVEPAAGADAADAGPAAEAEGADGATPEAPVGEAPDAAPVVPDGYTALDPLSVERQTAFEAADEVLDPTLDYAAVIETNQGVMVVDLFEEETPETVNNFVFLARHHYYDGIVFHRVIDGFMAQTGDPTGTGTGGPGYRFDDEIVEGLSHDAAGVLSMANAGPGTNGSQFFLTFAATPWLDGAHTVFGRVTEGVDVLDDITRVDPQEPSVVVLLGDPAAAVREAGIELEGEGTVEEALTAALGAAPVPGPGYDVAGARVTIGTVSGEPAAGFFPYPDRMERVTIVARPRG